MSNDLQRFRQRLIDAAATWGLGAIIVVLGFVFTYQFVEPAPPQSIVMATGQDGGAYQYYGEQFAAYLEAQGIATELVATAGSVENLALLESGDAVDIGFVQGGLAAALPSDKVVALGSLYLEPVWLFLRSDVQVNSMDDFAGKRIAVGAEGSGTRAVVLTVLNAHGINADKASFSALAPAELTAAFASNSIDAAFLIGGPESAAVAALISQPGIVLQSLDQSAAYVRRFPYFSSVSLPQGVLDLTANIPDTDINTVALTAMLAANEDLHPALVDLLLLAATNVFGKHTLLADVGDFPTARYADLPLSDEAARHFKNGPPLLMRYLPFWAATLIDRLWIMLLPIIGLAIPLVKLVPPAYRWRIRRRLLRLYAELEQIDPLVNPSHDAAELTERLQRLEKLDTSSTIGSVPKSYTDDIYRLRRDIDLVRRRLSHNLAASKV